MMSNNIELTLRVAADGVSLSFDDELITTTNQVLNGEFGKGVKAYKLNLPVDKINHVALTQFDVDLTPRQEQIFYLVRAGFCNREISEKLQISQNTVKAHIQILFKKLNVKNRNSLSNKLIGKL